MKNDFVYILKLRLEMPNTPGRSDIFAGVCDRKDRIEYLLRSMLERFYGDEAYQKDGKAMPFWPAEVYAGDIKVCKCDMNVPYDLSNHAFFTHDAARSEGFTQQEHDFIKEIVDALCAELKAHKWEITSQIMSRHYFKEELARRQK